MAIYIDAPNWPGHGRFWAHLISDSSFEELNAFADRIGIPRRAFDHDHYDVPDDRVADCVAAGAEQRWSRELVAMLTAAGLRRRKRSRLAR